MASASGLALEEKKDQEIEPYIRDAKNIRNPGEALQLRAFLDRYFADLLRIMLEKPEKPEEPEKPDEKYEKDMGKYREDVVKYKAAAAKSMSAYLQYLNIVARATTLADDQKFATHLKGLTSSIGQCLACGQLEGAKHSLDKMSQLIQGKKPEEKVVEPATLLEDAPKIESTSNSTLARKMEDWVEEMCKWLNGRGCWTAKEKTHVGQQHTPYNCKDDLTSLDFQGIREGSEGTFWIDLQGQEGKDNNRKSYCQVLIQTCIGPVPEKTIVAALMRSLKEGKKRAIIYNDGESGRPK